MPALDNRIKWIRSTLIMVLAVIWVQVLTFWVAPYIAKRQASGLSIRTFHSLWELGFLIGVPLLLKRSGFKLQTFFGGTICAYAVMVIGAFLPVALTPFPPHYLGVESRLSLQTHEEGPYDEVVAYDYPLALGDLYAAADPELILALQRAQIASYVATRGFLFWQTGLAYGFYPMGVDAYSGYPDLAEFIALVFTVGPLVILESAINALPILAVLLLVQLIRLRKGPAFWE